MPQEFRELVLKHAGQRIAIMGGAPSLPEHVPQIEADVWISTNAHGLDLHAADYVMAMDQFHSQHGNADMGRWLRKRTDLPIISPWHWADYVVSGWPNAPAFMLTGMVAAWCAFGMGASVIILCGMDGYNGGAGARKWAERVAPFIHCPVRVFGGGFLTRWWPAYDPAETFPPFQVHPAAEAMRGIDNAIRVKVNKPTQIRGIDRVRGEELTLQRHEVKYQLKHKLVLEL